MAYMNERASTAIDAHVGRRIRMRRNALKLSQTDLGEAVGVSFQQFRNMKMV